MDNNSRTPPHYPLCSRRCFHVTPASPPHSTLARASVAAIAFDVHQKSMRSLATFDVASFGSMISACLVAAAISGCTYPNQFRNVETSAPHALLTAGAGDHWRDRGPTVFAINSQPASFWRSAESFRIPPGTTTLDVIADREPYAFAPLNFDAIAGRHYLLRYGDTRSFVALYDVTDRGKSTLIKSGAMEVKSSSEASTQRGGPNTAPDRNQPIWSGTNRTLSAASLDR